MSAPKTSTLLTVAGATVAGGLLAYAVYFDYKRRNDTEFRKKLRKDKKKAEKSAAAASQAGNVNITPEELHAALAKIKAEKLPDTVEEKEQYFMSQVGLGEQLCVQGPAYFLSAALAFFRALRVYPSPVELIVIYQKTVPEPVFKLIMELTNLDVKNRVEGYYEKFPARRMNVTVQEKGDSASKKKALVAEKDFEAGEEIYTEEPLAAVLDADLQESGAYCTHCLRLVHKAEAIAPENDRLGAVYCSKDCQVKSKAQSHGLLFTLDPVLPPEIDSGGLAELTKEPRDKAQTAFVDYLKSSNKNTPRLTARTVARLLSIETAKLTPKKTGTSPVDMPPITEDDSEYGIADHLERLRFVETPVSDEERELLGKVFGAAFEGLEHTLDEGRHAMYARKAEYNAIGIAYSGGRDDRPSSAERPEDQERTRTPYGTGRQIGSGLYLVSSYISHSCDPNVRPSFKSGTSQLHLIANRPIKKGDELTMAFVDVSKHDDETPEEARRRRRYELARGWRFKCECSRCLSEGSGTENLGVSEDESKVEAVVERVENGEAGVVPDTD